MNSNKKYAKKMLLESKQRERADFAVKTPSHKPEGADDEAERAYPPSDEDIKIEHFLNPSVDDQLGRPGSSLTGFSIMEELFLDGTKQFIPGPVGAYKKRKPNKPAKAMYPAGHYRQQDMLLLRHKNDLNIARLLREVPREVTK